MLPSSYTKLERKIREKASIETSSNAEEEGRYKMQYCGETLLSHASVLLLQWAVTRLRPLASWQKLQEDNEG